MQRVLELKLELTPHKELKINGVHIENDGVIFEESIFQKQPSLEHQWMAICHLKKLLNKMQHAHEQARLQRGDITEVSLKTLKKHNAAKAAAVDVMRKKPGWM